MKLAAASAVALTTALQQAPIVAPNGACRILGLVGQNKTRSAIGQQVCSHLSASSEFALFCAELSCTGEEAAMESTLRLCWTSYCSAMRYRRTSCLSPASCFLASSLLSRLCSNRADVHSQIECTGNARVHMCPASTHPLAISLISVTYVALRKPSIPHGSFKIQVTSLDLPILIPSFLTPKHTRTHIITKKPQKA